MEDKYIFCVKCDSDEELNAYTNAVRNANSLDEIYRIAKSYHKHIDYSKENYDELIIDIMELSYNE